MFDRVIQLLMLFVSTVTLIVTLLPPPALTPHPAALYARSVSTGAAPQPQVTYSY